ncbi:hypothetical protein BST61_g783 [Cercospora zeina]
MRGPAPPRPVAAGRAIREHSVQKLARRGERNARSASRPLSAAALHDLPRPTSTHHHRPFPPGRRHVTVGPREQELHHQAPSLRILLPNTAP